MTSSQKSYGKVFDFFLFCREAGTSRYTYVFGSPWAWLEQLSLINYDSGYLLTTPAKTSKSVYFNGTTAGYPLAYTLAGAGLVGWTGEWKQANGL